MQNTVENFNDDVIKEMEEDLKTYQENIIMPKNIMMKFRIAIYEIRRLKEEVSRLNAKLNSQE